MLGLLAVLTALLGLAVLLLAPLTTLLAVLPRGPVAVLPSALLVLLWPPRLLVGPRLVVTPSLLLAVPTTSSAGLTTLVLSLLAAPLLGLPVLFVALLAVPLRLLRPALLAVLFRSPVALAALRVLVLSHKTRSDRGRRRG